MTMTMTMLEAYNSIYSTILELEIPKKDIGGLMLEILNYEGIQYILYEALKDYKNKID